MMSVKDYATDINLSVAEVLKKCKELGIDVSDKDDMLNDDDTSIPNSLHFFNTSATDKLMSVA